MNETLRELDHRTSDRIDVWLLWREHDNQVLVSVADVTADDAAYYVGATLGPNGGLVTAV